MMTATVWGFALEAQAAGSDNNEKWKPSTVIVSHEVGVTDVAPAKGSVVSDISITHTQKDILGKVSNVHTNITDCKEEASKLSVGDIALITKTLVNNDKALEEKINNISVSDTDTDTKTAIEIKQKTNADGSITVDVKQTETQVDVKDNNTVIKTTTTTEQISGIAGTGYVDKAVAAEKALREAADKTLQDNIDKEAATRADNDIVGGKINSTTGEITLTKGDQSTISVGEICDSRLETATYDSEKGELTLTVKDHYNNDQEKEIKVGDIASKEKLETETKERIAEDTRIEQKFDGEVSRLDSKIDKLDGRIEKVGAMSAAIANLHTMGYDPAAPTEIAVGVGQYRDKTGLAVGAFHYPNRDFMMSFSVSTAGDEFMAGIGATWKIGRKSPEQMLKAQQEKAAREKLAEAEAMKQAAKDARVAAQQARHAKMLAERSK